MLALVRLFWVVFFSEFREFAAIDGLLLGSSTSTGGSIRNRPEFFFVSLKCALGFSGFDDLQHLEQHLVVNVVAEVCSG